MSLDICCPSCGTSIRVRVSAEEVRARQRKGPAPHEYNQEIYDLVIDGIEKFRVSFSRMAEMLQDQGVLTPNGGKRWYPASARRLYLHALEHTAQKGE